MRRIAFCLVMLVLVAFMVNGASADMELWRMDRPLEENLAAMLETMPGEVSSTELYTFRDGVMFKATAELVDGKLVYSVSLPVANEQAEVANFRVYYTQWLFNAKSKILQAALQPNPDGHHMDFPSVRLAGEVVATKSFELSKLEEFAFQPTGAPDGVKILIMRLRHWYHDAAVPDKVVPKTGQWGAIAFIDDWRREDGDGNGGYETAVMLVFQDGKPTKVKISPSPKSWVPDPIIREFIPQFYAGIDGLEDEFLRKAEK